MGVRMTELPARVRLCKLVNFRATWLQTTVRTDQRTIQLVREFSGGALAHKIVTGRPTGRISIGTRTCSRVIEFASRRVLSRRQFETVLAERTWSLRMNRRTKKWKNARREPRSRGDARVHAYVSWGCLSTARAEFYATNVSAVSA